MHDYLADRADVLAAFKEDGMLMTLAVPGASTFDHILGAYSAATAVQYTGYGLVKEYKAQEIDGTVIQRGDQKVLVVFEDASIVPATTHNLSTVGNLYAVQNVGALAPAGVVIFFTLQVRR